MNTLSSTLSGRHRLASLPQIQKSAPRQPSFDAVATMRYARADLDLKRRALAQVFPHAVSPPPGGRLLLDGSDLAGWLRKL